MTRWLRIARGGLVVPAPVVPEAARLIEDRLGPTTEAAFLRLVTTGEPFVVDLVGSQFERCIGLLDLRRPGPPVRRRQVVTVAENERITTAAALGHGYFRVGRPTRRSAAQGLGDRCPARPRGSGGRRRR